jgi:glycosidase
MPRSPASPTRFCAVLRKVLLGAALLGASACGGDTKGTTEPVTPPVTPPPVTLPEVNIAAVAEADPGTTLPSGWQYGGMMEVYVRGYQDSNGDGIGDLKGLTQRLDYLADLGVKGLWLMPITKSQDHDHGYAVADYRDVETQFGTLADLDALIAEAHRRGIGIILDYVMNHSASQHPAFVNSKDATTNAFRNWYVWQSSRPQGWSTFSGDPWRSGGTGWYYGIFSDQMPDWNLLNADVVAWHHNNLRFWLNRGIDGFRFDAVGNLVENGSDSWLNSPQNYTLMGAVQSTVSRYANRYMVCEAPDDPIGYAQPTACGSAFAFRHQSDLLDAAKGNTAALQRLIPYATTVTPTIATMLSNHDSFAGKRAYDQLSGNVPMMKLAAALYLLEPGVPFIYYGEEIGMAGATLSDADASLRTPMSWTDDAVNAGFSTARPFRSLSFNAATNNVAAQIADPNSLRNFYKAMLTLRNARPSLARGGFDAASVTGSVLSFRRTLNGQETVVVINVGTSVASTTVSGLTASATYAPLFPASATAITMSSSGDATVSVPAQSVAIFGR